MSSWTQLTLLAALLCDSVAPWFCLQLLANSIVWLMQELRVLHGFCSALLEKLQKSDA